MPTTTLQFDPSVLEEMGLSLRPEEAQLLARLLQNELESRAAAGNRRNAFLRLKREVRRYRSEIEAACENARPAAAFSRADVTVGALLPLGSYPQSRAAPEPIMWRVLEVRKTKALLLADLALDGRTVDDGTDPVQWDHCALRSWLNGDFLHRAFRAREQELLEAAALAAPIWNGKDEVRTVDRVFCLSKEETELLLHDDKWRITLPTDYARSRGVNDGKAGACYWWLRTTAAKGAVCAISDSGNPVSSRKPAAEQTDVGVRPAIWLKLDALR